MSITLSSYLRVSPAEWGVITRLSKAQNGELAGSGSSLKWSIPAPAITLLDKALYKADSSTQPPRATLMR